jgi:hypothetical protein
LNRDGNITVPGTMSVPIEVGCQGTTLGACDSSSDKPIMVLGGCEMSSIEPTKFQIDQDAKLMVKTPAFEYRSSVILEGSYRIPTF